MSKARELAELGAAYDSGALSNRNLIINGAANIYQRGSSTSTHNGYAVDRWQHKGYGAATGTSEQSTDAPAPFVYSIKYTAGGTSAGTGDVAGVCQRIEGNSIVSLGWGTTEAKGATLSFYVKSSVTGTFTVSARNDGQGQSYVATYTIDAANTWEYKTVTFPANTSGTWLTTNGIGIRLWFDLGSGTNYQGASDTWVTTNSITSSAQEDVVGTSGATFYLTGVQLEVGPEATPFEHRSYGDELSACMRYYWKPVSQVYCRANGYSGNGRYYGQSLTPPTIMRANPSVTLSNISYADANTAVAELTNADMLSFRVVAAGDASNFAGFNIVVDAEL